MSEAPTLRGGLTAETADTTNQHHVFIIQPNSMETLHERTNAEGNLLFIPNDVVDNAMPYSDYRALVQQLAAEGKTSGANQTPTLIDFTKLNAQRMRRIDATTKLTDDTRSTLDKLHQPMLWLVLTEAWCGDAAQITPVLNTMAEHQPAVTLRLILRDDHLDIMDKFLTNGGRSIPKMLYLDPKTLEVTGTWGPRPEEAQAKVQQLKAENVPHDEMIAAVHKWYTDDKTLSIQRSVCASLRAYTA